MLVKAILRRINDDLAIAQHLLLETSPLSALVRHHNKIAENDDRIKKLYEETTGKELKDAITLHEPETQIELLHNYVNASKEAITLQNDKHLCALEKDTSDEDISDINTAIKKRDSKTNKNESEELDLDEKRMKLYFIKVLINSVLFVFLFLMAVMIILVVVTKQLPATEVLKTVLGTIAEIIKFILVPSKG